MHNPKKFSVSTTEIAEDIRDLQFQQMADGLVLLGIPKAVVDEALGKARASKTDQPLTELARKRMGR